MINCARWGGADHTEVGGAILAGSHGGDRITTRRINTFAYRKRVVLVRVVMRILVAARTAVEWGDDIVLVAIGVEHAFPSIPYAWASGALRRKLGARSALAVVQFFCRDRSVSVMARLCRPSGHQTSQGRETRFC